MNRYSWFNRFAKASARITGKPVAFLLASLTIVVWAVTGPIFKFSDTWQLVINTGTTIVTFLMVFLIQNTQNRDSDAIQIKLDELIRATQGAHTALLDLEELDDEDLARIRKLYEEIATKSRKIMVTGHEDTGTPFVHIESVSIRVEGEEKDVKDLAERAIEAERPTSNEPPRDRSGSATSA